jgi:drug/metabolite transporter (DMT)-like permease
MVLTMPVLMVVWGRYVAYLAVMLPIALRRNGAAVFRPPRLGLQLLRAALLATSTILFITAVAHLPFADAVAIFYVYPFLMTALSPLILGERADRLAWLGIAGGFAGVLIVMRPSFDSDPTPLLLTLGSGALTAVFLLLTRMLAMAGDAVVLSTYTALVSTAVLTPLVPFVWSMPNAPELVAFGVLGMATSSSHWLTALAYGRAPATFLAPFTYAEIVVAVIFGLLFFGDWPDLVAWLGILVIILSGVFVARAASIRKALRRPP